MVITTTTTNVSRSRKMVAPTLPTMTADVVSAVLEDVGISGGDTARVPEFSYVYSKMSNHT